ncbi:hypothetical protein BJ138DRAFT_1174503 [Hygrophoropsis aurantiaca]|uniref:Uncharacterized protein n=1 Tax=Hygrophoropsis aurantiaca TaxID=72124 RepID=A0ACB8A3P6_9AGAM|nr:hypothetical protein BJ138DRAFT_1174503 [Hygrophoropsis aurantiaca]
MQSKLPMSPGSARFGFDDFREHPSDAPESLQLKLDIARVDEDVNNALALLSRLKVLQYLLRARYMLHESDSAHFEALSCKTEATKICQSMTDLGFPIQPTHPNNDNIINALTRVDSHISLLQSFASTSCRA